MSSWSVVLGKLFFLDAQEEDKHAKEKHVEDALQCRPVDAHPMTPLLQLQRRRERHRCGSHSRGGLHTPHTHPLRSRQGLARVTVVVVVVARYVADRDEHFALGGARHLARGHALEQLVERAVARHRVLAREQRRAAHGARVHFAQRAVEALAAEALAAARREHGLAQRVEADGTLPELALGHARRVGGRRRRLPRLGHRAEVVGRWRMWKRGQ